MYTAKGQLDTGALLKQYSPLVRRLAHQMIAKLPANVELDDLIQVGMIGRRPLRPLLVGADRTDSIKQAYAAVKLLVQRCGLMTFDLVLAADPERPRVPAIAERLASCADSFLGAVLHDWAAVDPLFDPAAAQDPALQRLLAAQLALDEAAPHLPATPQRSTPPARAAAPSPF